MNELTIKTLLDPLLTASRQKQLQWEDDPTGGALVRLGSNTLNIYPRKEYATDFITIRLLDAQGRVVDFTDVNRADPSWEDADELLRRAINSALRKDDVIQEALQALSHLS